jgi:hypothetical protein
VVFVASIAAAADQDEPFHVLYRFGKGGLTPFRLPTVMQKVALGHDTDHSWVFADTAVGAPHEVPFQIMASPGAASTATQRLWLTQDTELRPALGTTSAYTGADHERLDAPAGDDATPMTTMALARPAHSAAHSCPTRRTRAAKLLRDAGIVIFNPQCVCLLPCDRIAW